MNIQKHLACVERAAAFDVNALFFPELSLSSYEPKLAKELATQQNDYRLDRIQEASDKYNITIAVGLPLQTQTGIQIGMIVFQPHQSRLSYAKQQLHADECPYFEEGTEQLVLTIDHKKIVPAICYESLQANHAEQAKRLGADFYVASAAKPQNGLNKAIVHYPEMAKKYSMPVLLSNSVGYCDNFMSVGGSAVWTKDGVLLGQLDNEKEGLLIFDTEREEVKKVLL